MTMRKSSKELQEQWKNYFQDKDTTVQRAREKIKGYQTYCREQPPHKQLIPGYDMLAWIGMPMSESMHCIRANEVNAMLTLIPQLDFKSLKVLYHRLKTNWSSSTFKGLCLTILRRIAVHPEFTRPDKKIMEHHATLLGSEVTGKKIMQTKKKPNEQHSLFSFLFGLSSVFQKTKTKSIKILNFFFTFLLFFFF